jgi:aromatic ring-cleaving dioxygenase
MPTPAGELYEELYQLKRELAEFEEQVYGDPAKRDMSEYSYPTVGQRLGVASGGARSLTHGPTATQVMCLEIAQEQFTAMKTDLELIVNQKIPKLEQKLIEAGAPWMNGMPLK